MFEINHTQTAKTKPPTEFLARPMQRRILLIVMMVGGFVIMTKIAIQTRFWEELFAPPTVSSPKDVVPPQPKYYETAIRPQSVRELPLDTFVAQREVPPEIDPAAKFYKGVKPKLLNAVRDFTPFRSAENPAWLNLLKVLKDSPADQLKKASSGPVGFVQLYEQMDVYRGQLVTVRGVVKRAFDVHAVKNDFGIEKYYQLWFFPEGGPISPIVIYCLELPPEFPLSRAENDDVVNINENITLTGFAFKNWVYGTKERIESAPLLLAKSFTWRREIVVEKEPISPWLIGAVVAGTALMAILFTLYVVRSSNKVGKSNSPLLAHLSGSSSGDRPQSSAEVGQTLQTLAEQVEKGETLTEPTIIDSSSTDETST
jgi:hypothetical protein